MTSSVPSILDMLILHGVNPSQFHQKRDWSWYFSMGKYLRSTTKGHFVLLKRYASYYHNIPVTRKAIT